MRVGALVLAGILAFAVACTRSESPVEPAAPAPKPVEAAAPAGPAAKCVIEKLSPTELTALTHASGISLLASLCGAAPSFDTLYLEGCAQSGSGYQLQIPGLQGQMNDPRQDPDYDFVFSVEKKGANGFAVEIAFHPKRPGTAGIFNDGRDTYCNALGRASARPELRMSQDEINQAVDRLKSKRGKRKQ
jgi:hypothetical protein